MSQVGIFGSGGSSSGSVLFLQGNSGGDVGPDLAGEIFLLGSGGVTVVGDPLTNTLTISVSGSGTTWNNITASQTLAINNGYFCSSPGGALSLALPAVSNLGDEIIVYLDGATSWSITQGAGQTIKLGNTSTTAGVGGSITSTQQGDSLTMVCKVANLSWRVKDSVGSPTII